MQPSLLVMGFIANLYKIFYINKINSRLIKIRQIGLQNINFNKNFRFRLLFLRGNALKQPNEIAYC